ncbi:MAG TPA: protein kinase [Thermoanaerobaculia bacterium]|nr:protein kinase [Thermoanaerobaculia bacterium]HQR66399.1 protein kinase [Thermoanaerobaculia bacterium]
MGLPAGTRLGPYEVLAPLGAGGMGEVFRARDTRLGRQVAVKILPEAVSQDPRRVARFEKEARALAALSHPNILDIHDFGQSDGRFYVVTELLEGETLRDRMAGEPLGWRKTAEIAASIADGLASAHAAGIVHRDLKPENVFVTADGRVKVLDFGLAKSTEPVLRDAVTVTARPGGALSMEGEVVGTLAYMAPEQLRGLKVDGRTDIFALGCVLFEMLSGRRPFTGATPADTISAILSGEPDSLDTVRIPVPPSLSRITSRCLEKRPEDRFHAAHDLALALRSISSDEQPAVRSGERPGPVGRRPLVVGASVVAALLCAVVAAVVFVKPHLGAKGAATDVVWGPPRQLTSAPGWEAEPALSPDGTLVAYSSNASGNPEIWVVDADGGEPLRLTNGPGLNRRPVWLPNGREIAFTSEREGVSSVWKISRLGGSPTPILEDGDSPAISPDGTRLAFVRRAPGGLPRIWVAPLGDPSKAERVTGDTDGELEHRDPSWSPDGRQLCYADFHNLWLIPAGGGRARKLTHDGKWDREPAFSPDGAFVFFSSYRVQPQSIWRVALDGSPPERILAGAGVSNHPSFSPDGTQLLFSSVAPDRDVLVVDRKTGGVCRIASSRDDRSPTIALDGRAVAYTSTRLGTDDLWLEVLDGGCTGKEAPRRLTRIDPGPATPSFSPDGHWIAFFRKRESHREIWAAPLSGGAPVPIVEGPGNNLHPAYSPDGTRLAFVSDRAGHLNIWILPLRTGLPSGPAWSLTGSDSIDLFPVWSPDARRISFVRDEDAWIVEALPGASPRRVTRSAGARHLAWEPDGSALLVSGLFGTALLHARRVEIESGNMALLNPRLVLGDRSGLGNLSLSRDGRFLATDVTELKGNIWITTASRRGR